MPVLRTIKTYRCRSGKRFVRLYRSWINMRSRVKGHIQSGTGEAIWFGLDIEWQTYEEFHKWAVANGYSKVRCSLEREYADRPYTRDNCRWTTVLHKSMRALYGDDPFEMGGKRVRGEAGACPF
jgi:hypothetical protein